MTALKIFLLITTEFRLTSSESSAKSAILEVCLLQITVYLTWTLYFVIEKHASRHCCVLYWLIVPSNRFQRLIKADALSFRMNYKEILMSRVNEVLDCILYTHRFAPRLLRARQGYVRWTIWNIFTWDVAFVWKSTCRNVSIKCTKWRLKWVRNHATRVKRFYIRIPPKKLTHPVFAITSC